MMISGTIEKMDRRLAIGQKPPSYSSVIATPVPYQPVHPTAPPMYPELTVPPAPVETPTYYYVPAHPFQTMEIEEHEVETFCAHIVFACVVFWCCNFLFGFIAFIVASQYIYSQSRNSLWKHEGLLHVRYFHSPTTRLTPTVAILVQL